MHGVEAALRFMRLRGVSALHFVYPDLCIVCDDRRDGSHRWLCEECRESLEDNRIDRDRCPRCSINRELRSCSCKTEWEFPFDVIFSFFDFDERVRSLLHEIKYGGKKRLAVDIGREYCATIPGEITDGADIIAPVALHYFRRMKRGYNQAFALASGIHAGMRRPPVLIADLIRRRRRTKTQTRLSRARRRRNVHNAFALNTRYRDVVAGKTVLLVDDVVTTGATTGECAQVLKEAGCKEVRVVCLARD